MPAGSSAQRRSARTRTPASRKRTTAAAPTNDASPSHAPKRQRVSKATGSGATNDSKPKQLKRSRQARRQPEPEPSQDPAEEDSSEDEPEVPNDPTEAITPFLKESEYPVAVAKEHANQTFKEEVSAYAKFAGKTWTYYVQDPKINIGRASDTKGTISDKEPEKAHIDLGPWKLVSRVHATILYNADDEMWYVQVIGRNGIKLNNVLYKRNQETEIRSGDVLMIADTEMVFVCPGVDANIQPEYLARLSKSRVKDEEPASSSSLVHAHPQPTPYHEPTHISPYGPPETDGQQTPATEPRATTERTTTPIKNIMQAPYLSQNADLATSHSSQIGHPTLIMDDDDKQIDYSLEANSHHKPPMSYATLIGQAILSTSDEKVSLSGIYEWIKSNFSYYRHIEPGWQNSIRHNLSLNHSFKRVERENHAPGKGGLWFIVPDKLQEHKEGGLKITSRGGARQQSSNPSSPAPKRSPKKVTPPKLELREPDTSPVMNTVQPKHQNAQTPSRPPRPSALANVETQPLPQLSDDASPLPARGGPYNAQQRGRSPPTLGSSALFNDDSNSTFPHMITPAPRRYEPQMTAPSTQKLPSQWLPQSSPAPFWQMSGTTPARLLDTSPIKGGQLAAPLQSSSPPPPLANGSPTRARNPPEIRKEEPRINGSHAKSRLAQGPSPPDEAENDEDVPLDLMGSFPKIGQRSASNGAH